MKKLGFVALFALVVPLLQAAPPATDSDGDQNYHLTTVSWVNDTKNNLKVDDRYVTLIGRVTKKIHDGSFWFSDGTGTVKLDSNDKELPVGGKSGHRRTDRPGLSGHWAISRWMCGSGTIGKNLMP